MLHCIKHNPHVAVMVLLFLKVEFFINGKALGGRAQVDAEKASLLSAFNQIFHKLCAKPFPRYEGSVKTLRTSPQSPLSIFGFAGISMMRRYAVETILSPSRATNAISSVPSLREK